MYTSFVHCTHAYTFSDCFAIQVIVSKLTKSFLIILRKTRFSGKNVFNGGFVHNCRQKVLSLQNGGCYGCVYNLNTIAMRSPIHLKKLYEIGFVSLVTLSCLSIAEITVTIPSQLAQQGFSTITFNNTNLQQSRNDQ